MIEGEEQAPPPVDGPANEERATTPEAALCRLYHRFWQEKHRVNQYLISLEEYPHQFANYFFTSGLDALTLDQLLGLADIHPPIAAITIPSDLMLDTHGTLAPPSPPDLQLSIATFLMSLQSFPNKLTCCLCGRSHSRKGRVEACINGHLEEKPYVCNQQCGNDDCIKRFASKAKMSRHARPKQQRQTPCPFCGKVRSKQNIARHKASCPGVASESPNP
ncbi:hypothetical protein CPB86DRAFT_821123 [Serendipita vermifera]|nr:hypothetical protein CPB86DRAFT_821123 [Serendipita vermifera]